MPNHSSVDLVQAIKNGYVAKDKAIATIIAPVEDTTVASMAHAVGKRFILNNIIYEAIQNIAVGDTLTVNGNIRVSDDIFTLIDASKEISGGYVNWNDYGRLDVKNIIPTFNDNTTYFPGNTISAHNATMVVDVDGTIDFSTSASTSANTELVLVSYDDAIKLSPGDYILSGGIDANCYLYLNFDSTDFYPITSEDGEIRFTVTQALSSHNLYLSAIIGQVSANTSGTFYPMIRLASISNSDYARPCQTVPQLNERLPRITRHTLTAGSTSITIPVSNVIDSLVEFYTNTGINYRSITPDTVNNTVTLVFDAQETDVIIYCKSEGI